MVGTTTAFRFSSVLSKGINSSFKDGLHLGRRSKLQASPLNCAIKLYKFQLNARPLLTNCVTAASLSVLSDSVAQTIERKINESVNDDRNLNHSIRRSLWMALWGFTVSGLMCSYWLTWLASIFPAEGMGIGRALMKVSVNQVVMSPSLNVLFFSYTTYTRRDVSSVMPRAEFLKMKIKQDLVPTIKRSCLYWGSLQFLNFMYIPAQYTLLYTNVCFLLWTVYLSLVGFGKIRAQPK
jgi:protein Mpv17